MEITKKSLYEYLLENKNSKGKQRFFFDENRTFSSSEVYDMVINLANQLSSYGVKEGDLVALRTTRSLDASVLLLALEVLGTTLILCDPHKKVKEILSQAKVTIEPDFFVTNEDFTDDISANGNFILKNRVFENITSLLVNDTNEANPCFNVSIDIKKPALIIFTSGSTGKNKAVMLSQYNYLNHIQNYYEQGNYEIDDISVEALPLYHVFGLAVILMGLIRKYEIFFPYTTDVSYVAKKILEHKITRLDGVPSYANAIANYYKENNITENSLSVGVLGGAPSSFEQFCYIEDTLKIKLLPVYGMSECIAISAAGKSFSREKRSSSVGTRLPLCDIKILSRDGKEVGVGETGEITASGPMVMLGYYKDEEETNQILKNGRLYTGDVGYIDADDFLHITGRIKDIIIRNGNNISSVRIEQKIELIDGIKACAVVSIPDKKAGEAPGALVVLKNTSISYKEIVEKIQGALDKIEQPTILKVVDAIPLTSVGKTDKTKVKEILLEDSFS